MAIVMIKEIPITVEGLEFSSDGHEVRFRCDGIQIFDGLSQPIEIRFSMGGNWMRGMFRLTSVVSRTSGFLYTYIKIESSLTDLPARQD